MTQDKINLKRAMDALNAISMICDREASEPHDIMEALASVENIANRTIRHIACGQSRDMHMGAPGGDRSLLPECQCCGERMTVGNKEYERFACGNRINKEAWGKRVQDFLDGKL